MNSRLSRITALSLVLGSAILAPGTSAFAQDEAAMAAARALGQEGMLAAKEGRCEEAIDKLSRAKKLFSAPTILVPLGECQIKLGKVVAGTENLQIVARDVLGSTAPKAFLEAQDRARAVLPDAVKLLARLRVVVEAPEGADVTVLDNGETLSRILVGVDRPADPGKHVVEATAPGFLKATAEVTVQSGQRDTVTLKLQPDPNAVVTPPPGETTPPVAPPPAAPGEPAPPPPQRGSSPLIPAGIVGLGVGAAGLLVGGIFGGLALSKQSDLDDACSEEKVCPASSQGTLDDMGTFGDVSTIGFVVGAVGVAAGGTLLGIGLASDGGDDTTAASIQPLIGPGFVGVTGRF